MIKILDSTLREGEQTPGVAFDKHIKIAIASKLDEIGVDFIEAGHPAVTEEINGTVKILANIGLNATIGAHSRLIKSDIDLALESGVKFLGIFYCVTDERLEDVFKTDINKAADKIKEMISYAKSQNSELLIRYTPEDTVRSKYENVITASVAAIEGGADIISIADTTGFMVPGTDRSMYDYVSRLKNDLSSRNLSPMIAVHCHNDRGLALANALDAYRAGANIIDSSIIGLGERAGIVDTAQLLTTLTLNFGDSKWDLSKLKDLYDLVSIHSKVALPANYPLMGKNAFTHCAGVHTQAASQNPMHYEDINPELFNRKRKFALDHMSGLASLDYAVNLLNIKGIDKDIELDVLKEIKSIGQKGRVVELTELPMLIESVKHHKLHGELE